jgi:hypothetical protein
MLLPIRGSSLSVIVDANLAYIAGNSVVVVSAANPGIRFEGTVASYSFDSGIMTIANIQNILGVFSSSSVYNVNLDGIDGPTGLTGPTGLQGATGQTGAEGIQGLKGETGQTGAQGIQGIQGVQGLKGESGPTGAQGAQGIQGVTGVKGETGQTGAQGIQGIQGVTGPSGWADRFQTATTSAVPISPVQGGYITLMVGLNLAYITGNSVVVSSSVDANNSFEGRVFSYSISTGVIVLSAIQNIQGSFSSAAVYNVNLDGIDGPTGPTGQTGARGVDGAQGPQGQTGQTGIMGPTGAQGIQGVTGAEGIRGVDGVTGPTGSQGLQGLQGQTGQTGAVGTGPTGSQGIQGLQGLTGQTGAVGTGPTGPAYSSVISYTQYSGTPTLYGATGAALASITAGSYFYVGTTWSNSTLAFNSSVSMTTVPQFRVSRSGVYAISYAVGATGCSGDMEIFISKNRGNGADLTVTAVNQLLASARVFSQQSVNWTGYLSTTDYLSMGGYSASAVSLSANCLLTLTLV